MMQIPRSWIVVATIVWGIGVAVSIAHAFAYSTTAGDRGVAPTEWPGASALSRVPGRSTLVMFIHPECPCSRASLAELDAIASRDHDATLVVVSIVPADAGEQPASASARTTRFADRGGVEAERFGARTSGHVVLYDPAGKLLFSGGITGSRGHVGDNIGRRQVVELLSGATHATTEHAVFGCPLQAKSK